MHAGWAKACVCCRVAVMRSGGKRLAYQPPGWSINTLQSKGLIVLVQLVYGAFEPHQHIQMFEDVIRRVQAAVGEVGATEVLQSCAGALSTFNALAS